MKLVGAVMILASAAGGYLVYRRSAVLTLQILRALAEDLALLRCQICVHRRPLPAILDSELNRGIGGAYLWEPLAALLKRCEGTVSFCWESAVKALPPQIAVRLAPVGKLLPVGGDTLARAIDEVREELLALARVQQAQQPARLRLSAAMCFSVAALFILAFI